MRLNLDPRTNLVLALAATAIVVSARGLHALSAVGFGLSILIVLSGALAAIGNWLKLVVPMTLFFGAVTAWALGWREGLQAGLTLLWLTLVGFLFFMQTPPEDLANALVKSGMPYKVAFVVSAGMQFIPVLNRKIQNVLEAQKARGIPLKLGWQAFRRYPAILVPLLIQAFQLAEELAEAMECRGFGRSGRTFYKKYQLRWVDYGMMLGGVGVAGLLIWGLRRWS